ncbi:hypothetical protein FRB90_005751 [Tulasnella sp. 427]|nr:hypothetical protein FRB90_005751 [Tulasnella sp. 427]
MYYLADHPEIMWQERYAHDNLTAFMKKHDFDVTPHYLGLETAWRAAFQVGNGGRTVGFQSEMDALPGIGHACGHNLIAIIGVGCAIAVARALKKHDIAAKVVLLGTPAEEGGHGKVKLIDAGGYKEMDVCLMAHPSAGPAYSAGTGSSLAVQALTIQYFGHTSVAPSVFTLKIYMSDPYKKALTHPELLGKGRMPLTVSKPLLLLQIKPTHRVHGIIEGRDWAPNVIPDYAKCRWLIRAPTWAEVQVLHDRVKKCFEAASLATDCRMEWSEQGGDYDVRQNETLADEFTRVVERYGIQATRSIQAAVGGSTDFVGVLWQLARIESLQLTSITPPGQRNLWYGASVNSPVIRQVLSTIPTEPGGANHTALFAKSAATKEAHAIAIQVAKALAITGARILIDDKFMAEASLIGTYTSSPYLISTSMRI